MGESHGEGEGNDDVKILGETNAQLATTAPPPPSSIDFNGSDFISATELPPSPEKQFSTKMADKAKVISPHANLPQPETPPGFLLVESRSSPESPTMPRSTSLKESFTNNVPDIGKYFKERSSSLSSAISKIRISTDSKPKNVTEINLSGMKVIVKSKNGFRNDGVDEGKIKGRVTFFSRSNCRDCTAVRTFFREKGLKYVEINVDVYPNREKELIERTGNSSVPKIFFNEKMFGGLVALNSLRNSGQFDERVREMLTAKCPDDAPAAPVYGFDDEEEDGGVENDQTDEIVRDIVRVLRMKLPIQDRFIKMVRLERNCFAGSEVVEVIIHHLDCGRRKAVEIGKILARKHFIHHISGENDFEDGNHLYRFLEHEPFIPRCYNFRGLTNDSEPKSAALVSQRLAKIMSAILESYSTQDRQHVDYMGISNSEEFRRYTILVQELQRMDLQTLSADEHLIFFLNLYNAMVIHALIRIGHPEGLIDRRSFFSDFLYVVGGYPYSLSAIENGILRNNRKPPYTLTKPFNAGDRRLELVLTKVNPLIHFGLCNGTRSSPTVRFFTPNGIETQLRTAAREFFQKDGIEFDLEKRTVYISRIIKWFSADFGSEKEILRWIMNYLDATKAGLLTHLLSDGEHIRIVYQDYDWSANS